MAGQRKISDEIQGYAAISWIYMRKPMRKKIGGSFWIKPSKKIILVAVSVIVCSLFFIVLFRKASVSYRDVATNGSGPIMVRKEDNSRYYASLYQNEPTALQDSFVKDVGDGMNGGETKADIYFILHRYIDNGGNIYEIYDYIASHPELAFLKEAETIYPKDFELIKKRRLPFTYSDQGMYAYLAYTEIVEKHGYADVAALGTGANQYAKMAYYKRMIIRDKTEGKSLNYPNYRETDVKRDISKAVYFAKKAQGEIVKIIDDKTALGDTRSIDTLFGTEEYASALRYLAALKVNFTSPRTAQETFSFATEFAYHSLPELYLTVSLTNASTLLLVGSSTNNEIRNAVFPFFDLKPTINGEKTIIDRILRARTEKPASRYRDLDIDSLRNIVALGNKVPEFKAWLVSNGWAEDDFR